jgi:UDP-N-acetylmuramate--alanine ligase
LDAFHQFATQSQEIISWNDQHSELFDGLQKVTLLNPSDIRYIPVIGQHNRRNVALVQAGLNQLGINSNTDDIVAKFPGTSRRFEKLADNLYSDYGHHPQEIEATLQMASEMSEHIVLVYQPHQNIRQHEMRDQYTTQFEKAEKVYWLPTYLSREDPKLQILTPQDLIQNISNKEKVEIVELNDDLWQKIQSARNEGKLVLGMGAGRIDGWLRDMLEQNSSAKTTE